MLDSISQFWSVNFYPLPLQLLSGALTIAVHPSWAPLGAERFLEMVDIKFFSSEIPMFRALKNFLVQVNLIVMIAGRVACI